MPAARAIALACTMNFGKRDTGVPLQGIRQ